jgi:hypothetical protein
MSGVILCTTSRKEEISQDLPHRLPACSVLGFHSGFNRISLVFHSFQQNSAREIAIGFTMLCDVISAVTEFMARVLCSRVAIGVDDVAAIEAQPCV